MLLTVVRREVDATVVVVLLPQVGALALVGVRGIDASTRYIGVVRCRSVSQVRSEDEDVAWRQRHLHPLVRLLPLKRDESLADINPHLVRARDDLEASVGRGGGIHCDIGRDVLHVAEVSICSSVDVSPEAVAVGLLVVDLVFEQE